MITIVQSQTNSSEREWDKLIILLCNTLHTVQPFSSGCFFTSTGCTVCVLSAATRSILQSCARPQRCHWFPKRIVSHTRSLSLCKMQALGHYKICTICRNIFQLFAWNNAVDFFTRYISAGAAPGCLGIMSVCIEQKKSESLCPRAACAPRLRLLLVALAVQFGGNASSMACFFLSLLCSY